MRAQENLSEYTVCWSVCELAAVGSVEDMCSQQPYCLDLLSFVVHEFLVQV